MSHPLHVVQYRPRGRERRSRFVPLPLALLASLVSVDARADTPPTVSLSGRETVDVWDASGGERGGTALLSKLQISGTVVADGWGAKGLSFHFQVFRTDGSSLSDKVGDIQTVDSIETRPVTRLFESWIEQKFGDDDRSLAFRFGLIDLNADYDSVQTSSLFVNSSQGIGADLARSGLNGPSIYPVSSLGLRVSWLPDKKWTFRIAAFDGVPGEPNHPRDFVGVHLRGDDGALLVAQADYHLTDKAKVEAGLWRYTQLLPDIAAPGRRAADQGGYVSIEGPLPFAEHWSAWTRLGVANGDAQIVSGYLGAGLVGQGVIAGRPDDRIGLAIAHAIVGEASRRTNRLPIAETSLEASYQLKVHDTLALQPDLQYVVHPAAGPRLANAVVIGLRVVVTAGYPKKAPANEATDPTVPPDGPQPPDQGSGPDGGAPHG